MPKRLAPELARVQRAANNRTKAEREYLDSLVAARLAGRSAAEIGEVAGTTRQNVLKLTAPLIAGAGTAATLRASAAE